MSEMKNITQGLWLEDYEDEDDESDITDAIIESTQKKVSLWIKDGKIFKPSTDIVILNKLVPGIYKPSWNRDLGYYCEKLEIKSDELYLFSDNLINSLIAEVDLFWSKKDLYAKNNIAHKRGILLEGIPGCGKTSLITLLSNSLIEKNGIIFLISSVNDFANYIEFLRVGVRVIEQDTPIITIIEDIDFYHDVHIQLLDFLDGKSSINHHIVIATTNNTEEIEDTILRPSRIDLRVEMKLPTKKVRKEFLKLKNVPENLLEEMSSKSEHFSLADLKELFASVILLEYSIDDAVEKIKNPKKKKNYKQKSLVDKNLGFN